MDFQIIQFLDYQAFSRRKDRVKIMLKEFTEEEKKRMADYHFIIREYIKWEKENFARKVAIWEQEAMTYQMRPYSFRRCA